MGMTTQQDNDRQAQLEEIARRIHFYDRPPEGFDPRTAEPRELWRYGIPPQPNARELPMGAAFWTEMFTPPLVFTEATYLLMADPVLISDQLRMTTSGQRESSLNWSGAYITPRDGRQFTEVHGRWEVPNVMAPAGTSGNAEFRSSIWIGFDGQRRYFDSSLPQIGTAQFLNAPNDPPLSVWWQWWLRDNPATYFPVTLPLPIVQGHLMLASLLVLNETQVHFLIENRTTGAVYPPFTIDAPMLSGIQAKVSGATAEWIVERPTDSNGDLHELPDYHRVSFTNCFAMSAHMPPGQLPGAGLEQTLDGARLINMHKVDRNPSRTVIISRAAVRPDLGHVETTYTG
jgi:Peptidase A4 family